uniref:Ubiquitin-conjugating enzyme E2 J1 n=1 Tax=Nothobranchius furzeri TaxID=105023 RepID=A0A8C6P1E1_NOTFU
MALPGNRKSLFHFPNCCNLSDLATRPGPVAALGFESGEDSVGHAVANCSVHLSLAVKRLMKEAAELRDPTEHYHAQPLEDNLFEWHFSVRGPPDSDFDGGVYHGRIVLPPEYPMKPPSIILLTPNGRFEVGKKICLSISGHHPETWQPSWSIRTALIAIIGFMPTKGEGAIGSLDYTSEERRALAKKSQDFCCEACSCSMRSALLALTPNSNPSAEDHRAKELAQQINFKVRTTAWTANAPDSAGKPLLVAPQQPPCDLKPRSGGGVTVDISLVVDKLFCLRTLVGPLRT